MKSMIHVSFAALSALLFACGGGPGATIEPNTVQPQPDPVVDAGHPQVADSGHDVQHAQGDSGVSALDAADGHVDPTDDASALVDAGPAQDTGHDWHVDCGGTMKAPVGDMVLGPWSYAADVGSSSAQVTASAPANGSACTGSGTDQALDKPSVTFPCSGGTTYTVKLDRSSMVVYVTSHALDADNNEHVWSWTFSDACTVR